MQRNAFKCSKRERIAALTHASACAQVAHPAKHRPLCRVVHRRRRGRGDLHAPARPRAPARGLPRHLAQQGLRSLCQHDDRRAVAAARLQDQLGLRALGRGTQDEGQLAQPWNAESRGDVQFLSVQLLITTCAGSAAQPQPRPHARGVHAVPGRRRREQAKDGQVRLTSSKSIDFISYVWPEIE